MKRILVISTSPRARGNSETLADAFAAGAKEAGHKVKKISLRGRKIAFCTGCQSCHKLGHCVLEDDANAIVAEMAKSDVIVWATPIYYYAVSGQMKTMIDRANSLYGTDNAMRETYLIASAADDDPQAVDGAVKTLEGWVACHEKVKLKGVLRGVGLDARGAAKNAPRLLEKARLMGLKA